MPASLFDFRKPVAYNEDAKGRFHAAARQQLRRLANALVLRSSAYDLHVNKAGIAISGETILHADHLYVQVSQSAMGCANGILFRTCASRRATVGGANRFAPLDLLNDPEGLARRIREALHV